jgi:DNA mismatch repair protein MutL
VRTPAAALGPGADSADTAAVQQHRRELVNWAKGALAASASQTAAVTALADADEDGQALLDLRFEPPTGPPLELTRLERPWSPPPLSARQHDAAEYAGKLTSQSSFSPPPLSAPPQPARLDPQHQSRSHLGFQIHNRYLVTENDDGMVVIDQHALHERILYEQLREKVLAGQMETQRLLVPEPVTLPPADAAAALENHDLLAQLGIEVEPFGGDTVLMSSYPAMLANLSPADMLRQVVELLVTSHKTPERRDLLDELLHMIACKAAIKAGDRLAPEEITSLLEQRHHYQDSHHCPHGRPTALVFTREELDRRFKRT